MNLFAFIIAIAFVAFLFPLFKHMLDECWLAGVNALNTPDRVFHWFLGMLLCFVFMGIAFAAVVLGAMPASSTSWFKL